MKVRYSRGLKIRGTINPRVRRQNLIEISGGHRLALLGLKFWEVDAYHAPFEPKSKRDSATQFRPLPSESDARFVERVFLTACYGRCLDPWIGLKNPVSHASDAVHLGRVPTSQTTKRRSPTRQQSALLRVKGRRGRVAEQVGVSVGLPSRKKKSSVRLNSCIQVCRPSIRDHLALRQRPHGSEHQ